MRVLTLADATSSRGGTERCQLAIAEGLAARGHAVDLVVGRPGDLHARWRALAGRVVEDPALAWDAALAAPDLVYVHSALQLPAARALAGATGAALVFHAHFPFVHDRTPALLAALARVDLLIAVSAATRATWAPAGVDQARAVVVRNGVDTAHFRPGPHDPGLVVSAGRLVPEKGVDTLLDAVALLAARRPEVRLVVAGEAPPGGAGYAAGLVRRSAGLPVTWPGQVPDTAALLRRAGVVALPSRWPEPCSLTLLEALASGRPVAASATGGTPELLAGALAAGLVPPDDPPALAAAIGRLLDDPALGGGARAHALAHHTLARMVDGVEAALRDAARLPAGAARA